MSELTVTSRYAKSLIDLAQEQKTLQAVYSDMKLFSETLTASPDLSALLQNPIVSIEKKKTILIEIFGKKISKVSLAFLEIMATKRRENLLQATSKEFLTQYQKIQNIVTAQVVTATELSAENEKAIIAQVEKMTNNQVILIKKIDASLIGGFILTVGDRQIDSSISKSINKLKKNFQSFDYVSTL